MNIELILPQTVIDIDALQIAFEAYTQLVTLEGQEHPLPGLSLYNDQLFYVSFAQVSFNLNMTTLHYTNSLFLFTVFM